MKTCDYCGRENTDDAAHCRECGTRFVSENDPLPFKSLEHVAAGKKMFTGALIGLVGLVMSLLTWFFIRPGAPQFGTWWFVIGCGVTLIGGLLICRGMADRDKLRDAEKIGFEALSYAIKLEAEGRVQEALVVYQRIVQEYPDSNLGRDAKRSIKNLSQK
jgi:hypothetical protein